MKEQPKSVEPPNNQRFVDAIRDGRHQEAWDYILCWSWVVHGDAQAWHVREVFRAAGGNTHGLRRCPEFLHGTVRVFVGNYLKWLSDRMWDRYPGWDEPSLWRTVDLLGRSELDCERLRASKQEASMRWRGRKETAAAIASRRAVREYMDATNRAASSGAKKAGYR